MNNRTVTTPPAWMIIAQAEIGVAQYPIGKSNPRIAAYHDCTNICGYDDKASWCSSFINWCFAQVGMRGTGSALARSWLEWGRGLQAPVPGCVVVLTRDEPSSWKGHVGFFVREDAGRIHLLGGNQLGQVREHDYVPASVLGYRWPDEAPL